MQRHLFQVYYDLNATISFIIQKNMCSYRNKAGPILQVMLKLGMAKNLGLKDTVEGSTRRSVGDSSLGILVV